ncbi:alpha/beta fold hydrolase [Nocardioides flavescens]|uniref:Alpha/beta fold hydrolase n=1 Tax=Nocardioides flavescens TaxID=2691959 RepID=A0A6L7EXY9_9ACTN|nr:alpha/beta fold hydrolase [Nocardioides flavescens]MXG90418.1 alpha/beta fold hydrolase [Nocardioides flavescens]
MTRRSLVGALTGLLAAGLALAPLSLTAEAAPAAPVAAPAAVAVAAVPTPPPLSWGRCDDKGLRRAGAECSLLTVPLDYANPSAGTIQIAVSRIEASRKPYRGAVFTNPGGPGGSGITLSVLGQYVPDKVGLTYDWYGIDPRGVGGSKPALSCIPSFDGYDREPYVPKTQSILDYWLTRSRAYSAACAASSAKALLPHMKTTDLVNDFESLRVAIAQAQITWYGFSYGTYLGQVYSTLYPGSLKAMVLDGVVDPTTWGYEGGFAQTIAFNKNYKPFFRWVARYDKVFGLGRSVKQVARTYKKTLKALTRKPLFKKRVGPSEFDDALTQAAYYNLTWIDVAGAWSKAVLKRNGRPLSELQGYEPNNPQADNGHAAFLATFCTDAPYPRDDARVIADSRALFQKAPYSTWSSTWFSQPCTSWPVPSQTATTVTGAFTGPVLLTNESRDAATPVAGAYVVRSLFPTASLVVAKGTSHAVSLFGTACIDNAVAALLKKGTLPKRKSGDRADVKCQGLRPPNPLADEAGRVAALRPLPALP